MASCTPATAAAATEADVNASADASSSHLALSRRPAAGSVMTSLSSRHIGIHLCCLHRHRLAIKCPTSVAAGSTRPTMKSFKSDNTKPTALCKTSVKLLHPPRISLGTNSYVNSYNKMGQVLSLRFVYIISNTPSSKTSDCESVRCGSDKSNSTARTYKRRHICRNSFCDYFEY